MWILIFLKVFYLKTEIIANSILKFFFQKS